jgi:VIT1/CCC1 family predicted Fe2+/Mn2+ transporter
MPTIPHIEKHFTASDTIRDVVIGMSDGLTVPFALAAGLSGAISASHIIITAGLAEIAAGSIAMGLGGYLAARSDSDHYKNERLREETEVIEKTELEKEEVEQILKAYGMSAAESTLVVAALSKDSKAWVDFMMRFELGLEEPNPKRALISALTIAFAYIAGGIIPLSAYIFDPVTSNALGVSVVMTLIALAVFGYIKGTFTGAKPFMSALQTVLIGGIAAAVAFAIARAI